MKRNLIVLAASSILALSCFTAGCDRTVSSKESTSENRDGSVTTKKKTVTENSDGTVTKKEETQKTDAQ